MPCYYIAANKFIIDGKEIMMSDVLLIKCPFCGKLKATVATAKQTEECKFYETCSNFEYDECSMFTVVCDVNQGGCGSSVGYYTTKEEAIRRWNTRK